MGYGETEAYRRVTKRHHSSYDGKHRKFVKVSYLAEKYLHEAEEDYKEIV